MFYCQVGIVLVIAINAVCIGISTRADGHVTMVSPKAITPPGIIEGYSIVPICSYSTFIVCLNYLSNHLEHGFSEC